MVLSIYAFKRWAARSHLVAIFVYRTCNPKEEIKLQSGYA